MHASSDGAVRRWLTGEYPRAAAIVALTTVVLLPLRSRLLITDVAMLFLVPVVLVASRYSRGAALLATALSVALFDFFFVPPYNTFRVSDLAYLLTFMVMFVVALVMSGLTARIREQMEDATARERRVSALYEMTTELAQAEDREAVTQIVLRHLARAAGARSAILLAEEARLDTDPPHWPDSGIFENMFVRAAAGYTFRFGRASGPGTPHDFDSEAVVVPIRASAGTVIGVAALVPEPEGRLLDLEQRLTAETLAARAGLEFERHRPAGKAEGAGRAGG
jgi:two-component system sensor histidine kinase KdpD